MLEDDPQLRHRGHYQRIRQPSAPEVELMIDGEAIRIDGVERQLARAPMLGEHNEHVLKDLLGVTDEEFVDLLVSEVIR